jgi:hypothetical protein
MTINKTILLATASIVLGLALGPAHAQTVLPPPTPPAGLTDSGPKAEPVNECDSINKKIAELRSNIESYRTASRNAAAKSLSEAQLAAADKDTWQKEQSLRDSTSKAAQDTTNPADKKLLQQASGQHYWKAQMAKDSYETHLKRSKEEADVSDLYVRFILRTVTEITELEFKLKACGKKVAAGGNGPGNQVRIDAPTTQLGGTANLPRPEKNSGGTGQNASQGGSNGHSTLNLPLGEDPVKVSPNPPVKSANQDKNPDAPSQTPMIPEVPKKVSALPNEGVAVPSETQQDMSAPNLRAYFASQAQTAGSSLMANRVSLQDTTVHTTVPGMPVAPAAGMVTMPQPQIGANPALPYGQAASTGRVPVNTSAVSTISTHIGAVTVTQR